ncbi:6-bladed beta-propeller [Acidobacteriota bacterium]
MKNRYFLHRIRETALALLLLAWLVPPISGQERYVLTRDLSIGVDIGAEEQMFGSIAQVGLDGKDNIYVLDGKNSRIQKFDPQGDFVSSLVIAQGQGPSEVSQMGSFAVTPLGRIYVLDLGAKKIITFDQEGDFHTSQILAYQCSDISHYTDEQAAVLGLKDEKIVHIYDFDGRHVESFGDPFEVPSRLSQYRDIPMVRLPLRFSSTGAGKVFVLNPHTYEIRIFVGGRAQKSIRGKNETFKPLSIGKSNIGGIGIMFPTVVVLEHGSRLYVTLFWRITEGLHQLDIFEDGQAVHSQEINGIVMAVDSRGGLYVAEEVDYPQVVRYRVESR